MHPRLWPVALLLAACAAPPDEPEGAAPGDDTPLIGVAAEEENAPAAKTAEFDLFEPPEGPEDAPAAPGPDAAEKRNGAPACGQPIIDSRTRRPLAYEGIAVYSNGPCQGTGRSCGNSYAGQDCADEARPLGPQPAAVDRWDPTRTANRWQCVEFVKRVFAIKWGVRGWEGNGGDMLDTARRLPNTLEAYPQGSRTPPVPGDAVVYRQAGGGYGHVALISRVERGTYYVVGQNEALFERRARYSNGRLEHLAGEGFATLEIVGWVHAKANGPARQPPAEPPPRAEEPPPPRDVAECRDNDHYYYECNDDLQSRFRCRGGHWETQPCPHGCRRKWWDDECNAAPRNEPPPAASATPPGWTGPAVGAPCDYRYWNCTGDRTGRYRCQGGVVVQVERCAVACEVQRNGTDDLCAAAAPPRAQPVCADTCPYARDGECDDGGPGALYAVCELGTDCADCGRRD